MTIRIFVTAGLLFSAAAARPAAGQLLDPDILQKKEAHRFYENEAYYESLSVYKELLKKEPNSPVLNFNVGNVYYKLELFTQAVKHFEIAFNLSTDGFLKAKAAYNLGNSYYRMNKLSESLQWFKKSLKINSNDRDAKHNLEVVLNKMKSEEDKQDQEKQEKTEPSEFAKKMKEKAEALAADGKFAEAFEVMQEALQIDETVNAFQDFIGKLGEIVNITDEEAVKPQKKQPSEKKEEVKI